MSPSPLQLRYSPPVPYWTESVVVLRTHFHQWLGLLVRLAHDICCSFSLHSVRSKMGKHLLTLNRKSRTAFDSTGNQLLGLAHEINFQHRFQARDKRWRLDAGRPSGGKIAHPTWQTIQGADVEPSSTPVTKLHYKLFTRRGFDKILAAQHEIKMICGIQVALKQWTLHSRRLCVWRTFSLLTRILRPLWVWKEAMSKFVIKSITRTALVTN